MPRNKPTTKIDVIGTLDFRPENAVEEYFESKQQEAYYVKPPNWDSVGDTVELLYIRNEREHDAMLRLQAEMLDNARKQTTSNAKRIQKLYKIQARLRKRFVEVNSFIKDCIDKKRIADKKVAEEQAKHEVLRVNIEKYRSQVAELGKFREVLKATVKEFEPYERVLKDVVEKSPMFSSVNDCIHRCDALMMAQQEITRLEQQKIQEIEEMRKHMVKVTNEAALTVLGLKNDLTELERSYNQALSECLKWEKILATAKGAVALNDLNKERALDGVHYMYRLLCKRRNLEPSLLRCEVEKQLDFIKDEVEILEAVAKECQQQMADSSKKDYKQGPPTVC